MSPGSTEKRQSPRSSGPCRPIMMRSAARDCSRMNAVGCPIPVRMKMRSLSSDLLVGPRMGVSFAIELHNSFMDIAVEILRTIERLMSEVMTLQIAPENLDVVELRRVFRQPLNPEPVGAFGEGST